MSQKAVPTTLKKQGRRVVKYRDVDGKTYNAIITARNTATNVNLQVRMGAAKVSKTNVPVATSGTKQTNVFYFPLGH